MAIKLASAFVSIFARDNQLKQDLSQTRKTLTSEISDLQGMLGRLGLGIGGGAGLAAAVRIASAGEEMQSKFEAVFKSLSEDAKQFSADLAHSIGRSVGDIMGMMAGFQDTFVPLGFARERAAELSKQMTKLASDLASFNNLSDAEAAQRLTSALVGNHEAVRSFGVIITEASLKQELLNMGIEGGIKAATNQQKVMARLNIIMRSTTDAQGDALRTAGSFANSMRALTGSAKDAAGSIGSVLLPSLAAMARLGAAGLRAFQRWNTELDGLPARIIVATTLVLSLQAALVAAKLAGVNLGRALRMAMVGTGIGAVAVLIGTLIAGIMQLIDWVRKLPAVQEAWARAAERVKQAWQNMKAAFDAIFAGIRNAINGLISWMNEAWGLNIESMSDTVGGFAAQVIDWISNMVLGATEWFRVIVENWGTSWDLAKQTFMVWILTIRDLFLNLPSLMAFVTGRMLRHWIDLASLIVNSVATAINKLGELFERFVIWAGNKLLSIFTGENVGSFFAEATNVIAREVGKIPKAFKAGFDREGRFFRDVFDPSDSLKAAMAEQQRLFGELAGKKKELESARQRKPLEAPGQAKGKQEKKEQEVEKLVAKQVDFPRGFVGLTDLNKQIQSAMLKTEDSQKKMVGLMNADQSIQQQQTAILSEINENVKNNPAVAGE